jgi:hypothetical protein
MSGRIVVVPAPTQRKERRRARESRNESLSAFDASTQHTQTYRGEREGGKQMEGSRVEERRLT